MNLVILFAKYPKLGTVKTRLAKDLGEEATLHAYKKFLDKIMKEHRHREYGFIVFTPNEVEAFKQLYANVQFLKQEGDDLGMKMYNAFRSFVGKFEKILIVGSDIPHLSHIRVTQAFSVLDHNDVVWGPTLDGGYYLVGMKKLHDVFSGITWSVETVMNDSIQKAKGLNLSYALLPQMRDIDTIEDYEWLKSKVDWL